MGRHWTHKELKRCKIDKDWREIAQDRDEQSAIIETKVGKLTVKPEELEKVRKDEHKQVREQGCGSTGRADSQGSRLWFLCPEQGRPCQPSEAEAQSCSSGDSGMPTL